MMMSSGGIQWDGTPAPPSFTVTGHTGGFSSSVPIRVPSFRGLEPTLALTYGSSGRAGFPGVGWSVSGFGSIERKSAEDGWPNFDATDTFWLNGQKLIPCGASASPGCTSGGTHFTEVENYLRITQDSDVQWTITDRNGAQSVYSFMGWDPNSKVRFGITSRTDTLGNSVSYAWDCPIVQQVWGGYCYPQTVSYNGALVTFHRETRPDPVTAPAHIRMDERLNRSRSRSRQRWSEPTR